MRKKYLLKGILATSISLMGIVGYSQDGRLPVMSDGANRISSPSIPSPLPLGAQKVVQKAPVQNKMAAPLAAGDVLVNNNVGATGTSNFTQSETSILAFGNNVVIGFNDAGSRAAGAHFTGWSYSSDGGATFTDGGNLPVSSLGDAGDPVLARNNASGRIYFSTLGFNSPGTIQMWRSDNNGVSWMAPVDATPGGTSEDKQWHIVDNYPGAGNGNVYVLSRRFAAAQGIYFFRSTDDGATFGPNGGTLIVSPAVGGNVQGAFITVSPDHSISAFYFDDVANDIRVRRSTDFGATWSAAVIVVGALPSAVVNGGLGLTGIRQGTAVASGFRSNSFPHATVNPVSGHLYVTYNNDAAGTDRADVFYVMSTNNGATWSAPVRVNDDATTTDQWQPTLAVSPDGLNIGFFYYSRQEDATDNNLIKYYGRTGTISGATITLTPSFAVSDVATIPEFGRDAVVNATYMGDYNQAVTTATDFHIVWSDTRDNLAGGGDRKDPNVYYQKVAIAAIDNEDPVITCPANITTTNDAGLCSKTVNVGMATATDNSGTVTVTGVRSDALALSAPFLVGTTTIVWTATDPSNNSATCTQTIVVTDNELPNAQCKSVSITLVGGTASITVADVNNGSTDNCAIQSVTVSKTVFGCADVGNNTVTLTVTDIHGNVNTCTATVTVVGEVPVCSITSIPSSNVYTGGVPTNIYLGYGPQSTTLKVSVPSSGAPYTYSWSPATGLSSATSSAPVFTPTAEGIYTFVVTVTNKYGCSNTCSITICVLDIRVPGSKGKKVYVCHTPPGFPTSPQTLSLNISAVPTHIFVPGHGDRLGTCQQTICGAPRMITNVPDITASVIEGNDESESLQVSALPNPTSGAFTLRVASSSKEPIIIRIADFSGRIVLQQNNVIPNSTLRLGEKLFTGTYLIEARQGSKTSKIKVLKIK